MDDKIVNCPRCQKRCLAGPDGNQEARPLRRARKGMCLECCVSGIFQSNSMERGIGFALPKNFDPEGLRLPHIQEQFSRVLQVGMSEANLEDIDWDEVIANWGLPFPKKFA